MMFTVFSIPVMADAIPYANVGFVAPTNVFHASATGDVIGYFVQGGFLSGGPAAFLDFVKMRDLSTNTESGLLFNNQTTAAGASANFGHVNAGDLLVFFLFDQNLNMTFASDPALSVDGINHAYATAWGGGLLNGANIPAGTYVGMEDLPATFADFNYNDDSFVFTNTKIATVPEPNSLRLLASGLVGLGLLSKRLLS